MNTIDILAIGAHQDDVEVGISGTLLKAVEGSQSVGILDLTKNEMNSRASIETIEDEAEAAQEKLSASFRKNLDLGDTQLRGTRNNAILVADVIRKHQPKIILAPYGNDLHNDHNAAGDIVEQSLLFSKLKGLECEYEPHSPTIVLYYFLQLKNPVQPTFMVDTSDFFEKKIEVLSCFASQFGEDASQQDIQTTGISDFMFHFESRDRFYGSLIDTTYGEPLYADKPIHVHTINQLVK